MEFKKYSSIENHYAKKEIQKMIEIYPELKTELFSVQEKIHGANVSLIFNPNQKVQLAKRTSLLSEAEADKFFSIKLVVEEYKSEINKIQQWVDENNKSIIVYGELFGSGIQKGVDYGTGKFLRFFDIRTDGMGFLTPKEFFEFMDKIKINKIMLAPELAIIKGIDEALNFDEKFNSVILNKENNEAEGVVIKTYNKIYSWPRGGIFFVKKKSEKFKEKHKARKYKLPRQQIDPGIQKLHEEYLSYITKNRIEGIFSKHGEIQSVKDIGNYLKLLVEDAKKDFQKDFPEVKVLEKSHLKYIYHIAGQGFKLLKEYL